MKKEITTVASAFWDCVEAWRELPEGRDPLAHMTPIKNDSRHYGACTVSINGNPEFIDAVLSRLKPLLASQNLVADRSEVHKTDGQSLGVEVCDIRLRNRSLRAS